MERCPARFVSRVALPERPRTFIAFMLLAPLWTACATIAAAQTFVPEGPAPHFGPTLTVQSGDAPPNGTTAGAVNAILTDPTNANVMYIGAVNGGVWATTNGGATWTPLSDTQRSLSIASLATDPTNANVLVAGIGITSSSRQGGLQIGILYSNNSGASWSELGGTTLQGKSIVGVAARGSTILAAASEPWDANAAGGLFRSVDTGASFQPVTFGSGGGTVAVTSLAADPNNQSVFYAAVSSTVAANRGVYFSSTSGASWTMGLPLAPGQNARLATGPGGSVVAGLYDSTTNQLVALKLSQHFGAVGSWVDLAVPQPSSFGQSNTLLALAIDPRNPNIVYVGGTDEQVPPLNAFTLGAFRVTLGNPTPETLTLSGTLNGSTAHPDARAFAFDANGRLIMVDDGGVYARSNPQSSAGTWTGLNSSTLQVSEGYAIAYDAVSKRLILSSQDTGTGYQGTPGGPQYTAIGGGDGVNAAVNDTTLPSQSAIYTSSQNLGILIRRTVDPQGTIVDTREFVTTQGKAGVLNFEANDFTVLNPAGNLLPFSSKIVLNKIDPTMIAFGTNYIYTTVDASAGSDRLVLTNLGTPFSTITPGVTNNVITALDYGTSDNINALLVGANNGGLYLTSNGTPGSLQPLTGYGLAGGVTPTSVVFDHRAFARFFAVDQANVWGTTNAGGVFTPLTGNLTGLGITRPTSLEFIANNGVNALLVGGLNNGVNGQSPVAVADSDAAGNLANWRPFGFGLPNTFVYQMAYNPAADVLAMSLFGRGAWLLYDTTTWFPTATVLRFGAADNDSAPPASILTNGLYASRALEKVGSGILTINGATSYTGSTSVLDGTLVANGNLTSSRSLFVGPGATLRGTGIVPSTVVSGTVAPGNSIGTLTVNGNFTQNGGSVYQVEANSAGQSDKINVSGSAAVGGSVQVLAQPGNYGRSTKYTILSAAGGLSGTYADVSSNFAFLRPFLGYDANNVYLTLLFGSFASGAQTNNQYAVGTALDQVFNTPSGDFNTVLDALASLSTAQAPGALDAISGQPYADFGTMNVQGGALFMNALGQQMAMARGAGTGSGGQRRALAQACEIVSCEAASPWGTWASALGGLGSVAGNGNASTLTYNFGGGAAGLDYRSDPNLLVGLGAGYAAGNQWVNSFMGRGWTDSVSVALYGSFTWQGFHADALAGYAYSNNQLQRQIVIPGLQPRTANGSAGANQVLAQVETGFSLPVFAPAAAKLTPFGRLQISNVTQNAFSEWGANSLSLNVAQQTTNSLRSVLGAELTGAVGLGDTRTLDLALRLGWQHEYANTRRPITAAFSGAPSSAFTVYGATPQRDSAIIGVSAATAIANATSLYVRYDGEIGTGSDNHALTAGLRMSW